MSRRKHGGGHAGHERWLVSYADFITLLFAFFVVLYASSKADARKQAQFAKAIDAAFQSLGILPGRPHASKPIQPKRQEPVSMVRNGRPAAPPRVQPDLRQVQRRLEAVLSQQIARHAVTVHMTREGLVISLREAGFYDSGSATPHASSLPTLDRIAVALADTSYDIRIEGHTDNQPIHTAEFASNWELSTARASRLARFLIEKHHYAPERLSASGYAEYHPVAANDTAEGRSENRRVDIIVLPSVTEEAKSPLEPAINSLARGPGR